MLLKAHKRLRQIAGLLETGSFLSLKLFWKRPAEARRFPGMVFRGYMSLVGRERWRSEGILELFPELLRKPRRIMLEQLLGDSTRFDFSPFFGQVDLVFVDGGHDYAVARSDTRNALAMLKPGGAILWDEFANYGDYHDVTRAGSTSFPRTRSYRSRIPSSPSIASHRSRASSRVGTGTRCCPRPSPCARARGRAARRIRPSPDRPRSVGHPPTQSRTLSH